MWKQLEITQHSAENIRKKTRRISAYLAVIKQMRSFCCCCCCVSHWWKENLASSKTESSRNATCLSDSHQVWWWAKLIKSQLWGIFKFSFQYWSLKRYCCFFFSSAGDSEVSSRTSARDLQLFRNWTFCSRAAKPGGSMSSWNWRVGPALCCLNPQDFIGMLVERHSLTQCAVLDWIYKMENISGD